MAPYEGSCHCQALIYTVEIPEEKHIICHCSACKVIGGGEYTLNQIVPKENLVFNNGSDHVKKYTYRADSGNNTDCFYCATCTASPYHVQHVLGPDRIVVRTQLLKGAKKWGKPIAEVYCKDKVEWQPQVGDATFDVVPPS